MSTVVAFDRTIHAPGVVNDANRFPGAPLPERQVLSEEDFCDWLGTALPGDAIEYHRGFLAVDQDPSLSKMTDAQRRRLAAVARRALILADENRVHLVQRRHGDGDYSYLAIKATPPRRRIR